MSKLKYRSNISLCKSFLNQAQSISRCSPLTSSLASHCLVPYSLLILQMYGPASERWAKLIFILLVELSPLSSVSWMMKRPSVFRMTLSLNLQRTAEDIHHQDVCNTHTAAYTVYRHTFTNAHTCTHKQYHLWDVSIKDKRRTRGFEKPWDVCIRTSRWRVWVDLWLWPSWWPPDPQSPPGRSETPSQSQTNMWRTTTFSFIYFGLLFWEMGFVSLHSNNEVVLFFYEMWWLPGRRVVLWRWHVCSEAPPPSPLPRGSGTRRLIVWGCWPPKERLVSHAALVWALQ